jgi:hypothetical protein
MKARLPLSLLIGLSLLCLVGCFQATSLTEEEESSETEATVTIDDDDSDTSSSDVDTYITLSGTSASVSGSGATVSGAVVTISAGGKYSVSGSFSDGQIVVNDTADSDTVKLQLSGASIACSSGAPLYVACAEKVVITLIGENSISGGLGSSADIDAAIYSEEDLTFNGSGSLRLAANGVGIRSKDGLKLNGGDISVTAAADGVKGKDYIYGTAGSLVVVSGGDGLCAYYGSDSSDTADATRGYVLITAGSYTVTSGGGSGASLGTASAKGIKAISDISISGGNFTISSADDAIHSDAGGSISGGSFSIAANSSSGQGIKFGDSSSFAISGDGTSIAISSSYEGIAGYKLSISGGTISVCASDDGFSISAGTASESSDGSSITISGGLIAVYSTTGDGVDTNGTGSMSGGSLIVHGPIASPEVAIDHNGDFSVTGGLIVAVANYNTMTQTMSSTGSSQYSVLVKLPSAQAAGTLFHVQDSSGTSLLTFKPAKAYQSVVFSSPSLKAGTYYFYYGGSAAGSVSSYGIYSGETYTAGTSLLSSGAALSSLVSTVSSTGVTAGASGGTTGPGGR